MPPEAKKVKIVRWQAPPYGATLAFMAVNRAQVNTLDEIRHARECSRETRGAYHAEADAFRDVIPNNFADPGFEDAVELFAQRVTMTLSFTSPAWSWLKALKFTNGQPGCFAALTEEIIKSVEAAKEEDATVAP